MAPRATPVKTQPSVGDTCLCFHMQRAARALARLFDDAFRPLNLTNGQFTLMVALSRGEPKGMGRIAAVLAMDRTTLTAALKPLERRGLVIVAVDPADKRGRLLTLTPAGRALIAEALPIWRRVHAEVEKTVPGGADRLRADLRALSQGEVR
jgi:DNA-binding MarR family transcriptional regulator